MSSSLRYRPFDFGANNPVLDFINTVSGRPEFTRDDLTGPEDLVEWARGAGIVTHTSVSGTDTGLASRFTAAVVLRENLYRVFGPIADGGPPEAPALAFVTRRAAKALRSSQWDRTESGFALRWPEDSLGAICDRLADEAVQLLRSPALGRLGSCAGCGWLFLDVSRAGSRRWCSMNACGVRDKMRRYHQRRTNAVSEL